MILRPFNLMLTACVLGVAFSVVGAVLDTPRALDPFTAAGLVFALVLGLLVSIAILRFAYAAALLVIATGLLLAPIAAWIVALLCDPLSLRTRRAERALIDRLYLPPSPNRRLHVPA